MNGLLISLIISVCVCEPEAIRIYGPSIQIQSAPNQLNQIQITLPNAFEAKTLVPQDQKFVEFQPNSFRLSILKESQSLPQVHTTILEDLRTPLLNNYERIFFLDTHIILFGFPNRMVILEEQSNQFQIVKQFQIIEIKEQNPFFAKTQMEILVTYGQDLMISIDKTGFKGIKNPFPFGQFVLKNFRKEESLVAHKNQFWLLYRQEGELIAKKVEDQKSYDSLNIIVVAFEIFPISSTQSAHLLLLDQLSGLYYTTVDLINATKTQNKLLKKIQGCFEMDLESLGNNRFHLILTCYPNGQAAFIRMILEFANSAPSILKKYQPYFLICSSQRNIYLPPLLLSLEISSIQIRWDPYNSSSGDNPHFQRRTLDMEGMETYQIKKDHQNFQIVVYSVRKGKLFKEQLIQQPFSLQVFSTQTINKIVPITLEFSCPLDQTSDNLPNLKKSSINGGFRCSYELKLQLNIHSNVLSHKQMRSINVGIILIALTVIIAIGFLCFQKYKNLEKRALLELTKMREQSNREKNTA